MFSLEDPCKGKIPVLANNAPGVFIVCDEIGVPA